jgi:spermidine synthase
MPSSVRWWFLFFLGSGFAGLVYEVVWLRLAMAAFGVTTPLVSIVLSTFMAGLALGSIGGGIVARRLERSPRRALVAYAGLEAVIAITALLVPWALTFGRRVLSVSVSGVPWDSGAYYVASAGWITLTLLLPCTAMGATYPFAMAAIRGERPDAGPRAFGFLYLSNVLGAGCGTLASAFVLIELLGFRMTLVAAAVVQTAVVLGALVRASTVAPTVDTPTAVTRATAVVVRPPAFVLLGLFLTGLASMAMELVWIRQFTPYLGNVVYAFAAILATYLLATFVGSQIARTALGRLALRHASATWLLTALAGLVPLLATDPRIVLPAAVRLTLGVGPLCLLCGLLTPTLVDRWSGGDPDRAGLAYAMNVLGSIAGPLVAGFWLMPRVGEPGALTMLSLPLFVVGIVGIAWPRLLGADAARAWRPLAFAVVVVVLGVLLVRETRSYETVFPIRQVRRDHTATVMATGVGMERTLQVNGASMTVLSPITKIMAHLPLAFLERPPKDALVICFGMGTTFRSLLTWDIEATAVELVPSVPDLFWYYHADALDVIRSPKGRIVIDDGRRLLERSPRRYDVITIDPPHPPEAAGSGLLYTREFYAIARRRLREGGILQQWIPKTESATIASVARAIGESFPHVRAFPVVIRQPELDVVGVHFLASERPIPKASPATLASRLPARAVPDLLEWSWAPSAEVLFGTLLENERTVDEVVALATWAPAMEDDRPFNEYYLLRRAGLF